MRPIYPRDGVANVFFKWSGIYPANLWEADIIHLLKPVKPPLSDLRWRSIGMMSLLVCFEPLAVAHEAASCPQGTWVFSKKEMQT